MTDEVPFGKGFGFKSKKVLPHQRGKVGVRAGWPPLGRNGKGKCPSIGKSYVRLGV